MELGRCSRVIGNKRYIWDVPTLWAKASGLVREPIAVESIPELDDELWGPVTLREAAGHFKRSDKADLDCPIILSASGWLMDGSHRIVAAIARGKPLMAVRFDVTPEPDRIIDASIDEWWMT